VERGLEASLATQLQQLWGQHGEPQAAASAPGQEQQKREVGAQVKLRVQLLAAKKQAEAAQEELQRLGEQQQAQQQEMAAEGRQRVAAKMEMARLQGDVARLELQVERLEQLVVLG
jgi:hypothetical protein